MGVGNYFSREAKVNALPARTIRQVPRLCKCGKQLGVKKLVSQPAVDWHSKAVLPQGTGLDVIG